MTVRIFALFTTSGKDNAIAGVTSVSTYVGLIKSITDWRAGTITEADFTGYARKAITWDAAEATAASDGRQQKNTSQIAFDANTGSNQDIIGYFITTASTAGTPKGIFLLDADAPVIGTVAAATDLITAPAHGLAADQRVFFLKSPVGTAPDAFAENTAYYVLAAGLTTDVFALSTTSGGAAVNPTSSGTARFLPYTAQTVATNAVVTFAAGAIKVQM
jgi:hypothetical protein